MDSTTTRRILRAADALEAWCERNWAVIAGCLLAVIVFLLTGCAQYETRQPVADRGTILFTWQIGYVPGDHCGWAQQLASADESHPAHWLVTLRRKPDFHSPECIGHEAMHTMGATHAEE